MGKEYFEKYCSIMSKRRFAQETKLGHRFDHTFAGISGIGGIYGISCTHLFYIINIFP